MKELTQKTLPMSTLKYALAAGIILLAAPICRSQTWQVKVIAAVLVAEAGSQGRDGMEAVGEVIHRRCVDKGRTPLFTVTRQVGSVHAFSCLNRTSVEHLVERNWASPAWPLALELADVVVNHPERLGNLTHGATHFTRSDEKPTWAINHKPVVVIHDHSFYRIPY